MKGTRHSDSLAQTMVDLNTLASNLYLSAR